MRQRKGRGNVFSNVSKIIQAPGNLQPEMPPPEPNFKLNIGTIPPKKSAKIFAPF